MTTAILGGGLMGAAVAYHLAAAGHDVWVFDRDDRGRATSAGAGIISGYTTGHPDDDYAHLAIEAENYYRELIPQLSNHETGYTACPLLIVALVGDEENFAAHRDRIQQRQFRWAADFGPHPAVVDVNPGFAQARCPALGPVSGALYHEGAARVDGRLLCESLKASAENLGARFVAASIDTIAVEDGRLKSIETDGTHYPMDTLVIAGGAWSNAFAPQLGHPIPVVPHRGQIVHLKDGDRRDVANWPIIVGMRGHYVVPWPDGHVVAGASRESQSGYSPWFTAGGQQEVLTEALRVVPGLALAKILEWRVGLRPTSIDGLPILGPSPTTKGIYFVTGHGPGGLLLGPYTAKLVTDLILGHPTPRDISRYYPARFVH